MYWHIFMVENYSVLVHNHFVILLRAEGQLTMPHTEKNTSVFSIGLTLRMKTTVRPFLLKVCSVLRLGASLVISKQQLFIITQPIYIQLQRYYSVCCNLDLSFHSTGIFLKKSNI